MVVLLTERMTRDLSRLSFSLDHPTHLISQLLEWPNFSKHLFIYVLFSHSLTCHLHHCLALTFRNHGRSALFVHERCWNFVACLFFLTCYSSPSCACVRACHHFSNGMLRMMVLSVLLPIWTYSMSRAPWVCASGRALLCWIWFRWSFLKEVRSRKKI